MTHQDQPGPEHQPQPESTPDDFEHLPDADQPRVWIGSLSDYTNGTLHGDWMDAAVEESELREQIQAMLARSEEQPAEEWMIFDYDNFGAYRVSEYDDLDTLTRVARGIAEHGLAFAAFAEIGSGNPASLDQFEDAFLGAYESREAWAQSIVDDFDIERTIDRELQLPDWLRSHIRIDLEGIAKDMEISGDVNVEDNPAGGVWVFDGRV